MEYNDKLPDKELRYNPDIVISGIDELRHMEENFMEPDELYGLKR